MTEYKFFEGLIPEVSTREFHANRERAPHISQPVHQPRLYTALQFIYRAGHQFGVKTVSDLGCGDGGLLYLLKGNSFRIRSWGYDFQPSNEAGWSQYGVDATRVDVFNHDPDPNPLLQFGDLSVMTEVIEHLADPHGILRWVAGKSKLLVASSPWNETPESHDACHAWGWNRPGYHKLINDNGWDTLDCKIEGQFHIVLARSKSL